MAGSTEEPEDRNLRTRARWRQTGRVLVEALPYILKYDQKTIVVKYGGNAMSDTGAHDFSQDIVLMKQHNINTVRTAHYGIGVTKSGKEGLLPALQHRPGVAICLTRGIIRRRGH